MKKQKPKPLSKDDFAKLMMDRIRQTGEKGKIVYDSKEFSPARRRQDVCRHVPHQRLHGILLPPPC